ncbi:beige/beach-related [Anaeramoeba ignava]|uniref:Beige/beach-related n=1 Tax=Anaeramoeba ignava TaxID=1746090 RepID=A0A9Q0LEL7_ANAIG|nr:beige/beach-related [Anaeramoeba ignava]
MMIYEDEFQYQNSFIRNPFILETIFEIFQYSPNLVDSKNFHKLFILIVEGNFNKEKILTQFGWQKWMISLINFNNYQIEIEIENENENENENQIQHQIQNQIQNDVNEIIFSIFKLLFIYCFHNSSYNFREVFEKFLSSVYLIHFSITNKQTIPKIIERIINDIFDDINMNSKQEIDLKTHQYVITSKILLTSNSTISKEEFFNNLFYLIKVLNGMVFHLSKNGFESPIPENQLSNQFLQTTISKQFIKIHRHRRHNQNNLSNEENLLNFLEEKSCLIEKGEIMRNLISILERFEFFKEAGISVINKEEKRAISKIIILLIFATIPKSDIKLTNFLLSKLNEMINQFNSKSSSIQNPQELIKICFSFFFYSLQHENLIETRNEDERRAKRNLLLTYLQMIMQDNYQFLFELFSGQNRRHSLLTQKTKKSFVFHSQNIIEFEKEVMNENWKKAINITFFPINQKIAKDIKGNEKEFIRIQSNNIFYLKKLLNHKFKIKEKEIEIISKEIEKEKQELMIREMKRKPRTEIQEKYNLFYLKEFKKMLQNSILGKYPWSSKPINILDKEFKKQTQNYYFNCDDPKLSEIEDEMRRQKKLKYYSEKEKKDEEKKNLISLHKKTKAQIDEIRDKLSKIQNQKLIRKQNLFLKHCEMISKTKKRKGVFEIRRKWINFFNLNCKEKNYSWEIGDIQVIHKRRYLFKHSGLEIFFGSNRKTIFFNFETMEIRNEIYEKIQNHKLTNINLSMFNYFGNEPTKWIEKTQITNQWKEKKLSNFEYLMYLNTISGRTYQDLSQYPIFPWIISDYESETLDLNNPKTFRDLSKPLGFLNNKITIYFEKYELNGKEKEKEYNYKQFYSNPEIVSFYLMRLEPFKSICLKEKYPIFKSIPETWKIIKEKEFIQIHKEALESGYVSEHLDEWIDLIFGYKQKGKEAKNSYNSFHPNLYEENIRFSKLKDKTETEIQRKGQIPIQLFKQKHPKRITKREIEQKSFSSSFSLFEWKNVLPSNKRLGLQSQYLKISSNPIIFTYFQETIDLMLVMGSVNKIVAIDKEGNIAKYTFYLNDPNPKNPKFVCEIDKKIEAKIGVSFPEDFNNFQGFSTLIRNLKYLISCGFNDNSFKMIDIENSKIIQIISKHQDIVNCLSLDSKYFVTGSKDTTVIVWEFDLNEEKVKENPKYIFFEHEKEVKSVAISAEYDVVLSGSIDGELIFHSLNKGKYIQSMILSDHQPISIIKISKEGNIITFSENSNILRLFTINGYLIKEVQSSQNIYSISITQDSNFIFLGGEKGILEIRKLFNLKMIQKFNLKEKIYSISIIEKGFLIIIGLGNGVIKIGNFIERN